MFKKCLTGIMLLMLVVSILSSCSARTQKPKLSELEEDLYIQYLEDHGVVFPDNYVASEIRKIIAELEADPDRPAPVVSWTVLSDFYEELRAAVKEYYGDRT